MFLLKEKLLMCKSEIYLIGTLYKKFLKIPKLRKIKICNPSTLESNNFIPHACPQGRGRPRNRQGKKWRENEAKRENFLTNNKK